MQKAISGGLKVGSYDMVNTILSDVTLVLPGCSSVSEWERGHVAEGDLRRVEGGRLRSIPVEQHLHLLQLEAVFLLHVTAGGGKRGL